VRLRPGARRRGGRERLPPAVGAPAPPFDLTNNEGQKTRLSDLRGKWVVLYFYPKDFTSGCTLEAHNFQRDLSKYQAVNAVIVGVSVDSADSHQSFCAREGLNFKLLSDPGAAVSAAYGSVMEYEGAKLSARNTFLIDPDGKLVKVFVGVKPAGIARRCSRRSPASRSTEVPRLLRPRRTRERLAA